jgi:signal transduction histidine kinase
VNVEDRVVVFAPTGKDARLIAQVLARAGVDSCVCTRAADVASQLKQGAGALLLVDEVLDAALLKLVSQYLGEQPTWSDLPILVMSTRGLDSAGMRQTYLQLGNVTLLERPLQSVTLVSAATSALRARRRQYAMREIDRRKDEFLAMLAHELRNPLAPVSAAADVLKLPNLDRDRIRQTSDIISRQVKHMTGLIDDLLDVSRVSRGLVALDLAAVDARQIVTSAVEQARPLIDARRHRLTVHTAPALAWIEGDQKRLVQILANVLNNAAKYTPEGGEIVLSMDVAETQLTYTVRDNGIGMAPHVIDHIFDMFAQAERTSDRTQGGLGIGLALVKNLVQLHGGSVTAHSDGAGAGSRFDICFPRGSGPQGAMDGAAGAPARLAATRSVLVVDDNVDAAMMLGMFLELAGYQVHVVHDAGAAIDIAVAQRAIDACLLDIGLPDMDGNALARRLRAIDSTAQSTLIAITGYGQENDRRKTAEAGFDQHHVKPVDMQKLMDTLASLP